MLAGLARGRMKVKHAALVQALTRVSSGRATIRRPAPGWPFCPPRGRPARARRLPALAFAFASAAGLSWLGGCEESGANPDPPAGPAPRPPPAATRSARPAPPPTASSSATRAVSSVFWPASSTFRAASSSYGRRSGCGIPEPNHNHKPDASTPQISKGPDWLLEMYQNVGCHRPMYQ